MTTSKIMFLAANPNGVGDLKDAANISITGGVGTTSAAQTDNVGAGCAFKFDTGPVITVFAAPNRIGYDSGSVEVLRQDKISDGTAFGIVIGVTLTSGTWAGGDAAGWVYFESTDGVFSDDDTFNIVKPDGHDFTNCATFNGTLEGNIGSGNTEFVLLQADGTDAANQTSITLDSINSEYANIQDWDNGHTDADHLNNVNLTTIDTASFCIFYHDQVDSTPDTGDITINNATDSIENYQCVFVPNGGACSIIDNRHQNVLSTSYAMIKGTGNGISHASPCYNVIVIGMQYHCTNVTSGSRSCFHYGQGSGPDMGCHVEDCIIKFDAITGDHARHGFSFSSSGSGGVASGKNIIIYGAGSNGGTATNSAAVRQADEDFTFHMHHFVIYDFHTGIDAVQPISAKNCLVFNNEDDMTGANLTADYCASEDGDGTNSVTITQTADNYAALVTDASGGDFSPTDGDSELVDAGIDLGSDSNLPIWRDIMLEEWVDWSIGAFHFEIALPPAGDDQNGVFRGIGRGIGLGIL